MGTRSLARQIARNKLKPFHAAAPGKLKGKTQKEKIAAIREATAKHLKASAEKKAKFFAGLSVTLDKAIEDVTSGSATAVNEANAILTEIGRLPDDVLAQGGTDLEEKINKLITAIESQTTQAAHSEAPVVEEAPAAEAKPKRVRKPSPKKAKPTEEAPVVEAKPKPPRKPPVKKEG